MYASSAGALSRGDSPEGGGYPPAGFWMLSITIMKVRVVFVQ